MEHDHIKYLRDHHPAVKLLKADTAPLIISFLFQEFKAKNRTVVSSEHLTTVLNDYLFHLRRNYGDDFYPKTAKAYLEDWSEGFLRKFYKPDEDEPRFELTPSTEIALDWIKDLDKKEFIGTESRLLAIFSMLKEIAHYSTDDPQIRIDALAKQKAEIEQEIERIKTGELEKMDNRRLKERFMEVEDTTYKLLRDFRQVEYNFRAIDTAARENIIKSNLRKGNLLDIIFKEQDLIWDSDQGKSFKAFWEYMMSQTKQDELANLIQNVLALDAVKEIREENNLESLKESLIEAGDKIYKTNSLLIEQLRKYLEDKTYLENKRALEIIKEFEELALSAKQVQINDKAFIEIEDKVRFDFFMERPLFAPPIAMKIEQDNVEKGKAESDTSSLYQQVYVNPEELKSYIRELLKEREYVSLKEVIEIYPVERGLAEVVTYFNIACKQKNSVINEAISETLIINNKESNRTLKINLPQTIFTR